MGMRSLNPLGLCRVLSVAPLLLLLLQLVLGLGVVRGQGGIALRAEAVQLGYRTSYGSGVVKNQSFAVAIREVAKISGVQSVTVLSGYVTEEG